MKTSKITNMGAIVLAAGQSRRMPNANKLLAKLDSRPLISHALATLTQLNLNKVIVVTGFESKEMTDIVASHGVDIAENRDFISGMGTSLATGAAQLPSDLSGCFVVLADMPFVKPETFIALAKGLLEDQTPSTAIAVPVQSGRRGHPVLFGHNWFTKLQTLKGDQGARELLRAAPDRIIRIEVSDPGIFEDIDTTDELAKAGSRIKT